MEEQKELPSYLDVNIKSLLCQAMINDVESYSTEELKHIAALLTMWTRSGSHAFFTVQTMSMIKMTMDNHEPVRRFVLNLYENTNLLRSTFGDVGSGDWEKPFIDTIKRCRQQYDNPKASLLLDSVCEWAQFDGDLHAHIRQNAWLLTLYLACFTGAATKFINDYNDYCGFLDTPESKG